MTFACDSAIDRGVFWQSRECKYIERAFKSERERNDALALLGARNMAKCDAVAGVPETTRRIMSKMAERSITAPAKYDGKTIDRDDLTFSQWADHAIEEGMDIIQYLERAKGTFIAGHDAKYTRLTDEITRLRTAVSDIVKCNEDEVVAAIAREALQPSDEQGNKP